MIKYILDFLSNNELDEHLFFVLKKFIQRYLLVIMCRVIRSFFNICQREYQFKIEDNSGQEVNHSHSQFGLTSSSLPSHSSQIERPCQLTPSYRAILSMAGSIPSSPIYSLSLVTVSEQYVLCLQVQLDKDLGWQSPQVNAEHEAIHVRLNLHIGF